MGLLAGIGAKPPVPEIKPDTPHYEAVGRFITSYANAESVVHMLARHLSGMPDEKARIVFGGMRLADLIDLIRQFMRIDAVPEDRRAWIDSCLIQLNLISKKRHSIVHRSSLFFDGALSVTNAQTSKSLRASEFEIFTIQELADMQMDCIRIYLRLHDIFDQNKPDAAISLALDSLQAEPWRYKPLPPRTPNLKPRAKPAKPKRQPPASGGRPAHRK